MELKKQLTNEAGELLITDTEEVERLSMELAKSAKSVDLSSVDLEGGAYSGVREILRSRIVGQEEAVDAVVEALGDAEFADPEKPKGTFLFIGPTGVGKTQLSIELAKLLHGDAEKGYQRVNCSQLKSRGDITLLQGAPPGYIGYDDSTLLDQEKLAVPNNILVFDEIEKAHPSIHDFLMQALDIGEITMVNERKTISLRESIIILTSNAGSEDINELLNRKTAGFKTTEDDDFKHVPKDQLRETAFKALEKTFRPELIGRIDDKILFTHLTDEQHSLALERYIDEINSREPIAKRGISLNVAQEARDIVVRETTRRNSGGFREVQITFRNKVEREFTKLLRSGRVDNYSIVYALPASEEFKKSNPEAAIEFRAHNVASSLGKRAVAHNPPAK